MTIEHAQAYRVLLHKHGADRAGYPISNHMDIHDVRAFVDSWRKQFPNDVLKIAPVTGPIKGHM